MKGADEFESLFPSGSRYDRGKLSVYAGEHARGYTLSVYANGVEVFGMTSGFRGWDETYGWLKDGSWKKDFADFCFERKGSLNERIKNEKIRREKMESDAKANEEKLLAEYSA